MNDSAVVFLRKEALERIETDKENDSSLVELYESIFTQLKQSAKVWKEEIVEFESIKPDKIIRVDN